MKPEFCTDEMLTYLDELRASGETNMFGAGPYLEARFPELAGDHPRRHSSTKTLDVLHYWLHSERPRE